jgi:hypothetical protein
METENEKSLERVERWFVVVLTLWASCAFVAAASGAISKVPRRVLGPLFLTETIIPILVYYLSGTFRAYIFLKHLTIFHLWRLLAGFTFVSYGIRHLLPETFVHTAGFGDIIVGVLVPLILILPNGIRKYIVFHVIGLLDFILALGTGIILTLVREPLIENLTTFPIIMIPLLGVPVSGALHVMAIDAALRKLRKQA